MYDLSQMNRLIKERRSAQNRVLREYQFTPNEIDVLLCLSDDPKHDTASDICQRRGISRSLVCRSVESLVEKGYIKLKPDANDRRYIHLILDEKALPIVQKLDELQRNLSGKFTKGIPEKELNIFDRVLAMMLKNAGTE